MNTDVPVDLKYNVKEELDVESIKVEVDDPTGHEQKIEIESTSINEPELQAEHFAFKWTPDGFRCPTCPFKTKIEGFLLNHIEKKHPELHIKREKILKCAHCSYQTEYKAHFVQHVLRKHTSEYFECELCRFKTKTEKILQKHLESEHGNFACHKCNYKGKSKFLLKSHITNKHKNEAKLVRCEHCSFKTTGKRLLRNHIFEEHSESVKWLRCVQCTFQTDTEAKMKTHMQHEHEIEETVEYECPYCDFKSQYKSGISRHKFYKHTSFDEVKWLECEKCPYKAKSGTFLKVHMINEHSETRESRSKVGELIGN